ncbi:MAG: hypothetical protein GFH27_549323n142 [Chloroflexi bacterium AL-W]|nr:hypothetical protein [Chloroflexi bacterium AL-N1]NOK70293.1 hypothetical protein [Chloroflexi bacterium AL-N10]NOK77830.1 hypothetical protein [Chloroflexi bacterium AL-N5]NOK84839.1 hypothetical protein [Chloroflexi bacterium AL-W]NOK92446.1 hypothetical protein [Chloroflexi bacterium AL-N15]
MSFIATGRLSESPYIECILRGQADKDHTVMCPADGRWNICIAKINGKADVLLEGPMAQAVPKTHVEGIDWIVIKLKLGVYIPSVSVKKLFDHAVTLPRAAGDSFRLNHVILPFFDFENADGLVDRLARHDLLTIDPIVTATLHDRPVELASRTIRHRFVNTIGLPPSTIRQIERARQALTLLQTGVSILDVVYQMGYADQSHLTRSFRRFMGHTPAQIPAFYYTD